MRSLATHSKLKSLLRESETYMHTYSKTKALILTLALTFAAMGAQAQSKSLQDLQATKQQIATAIKTSQELRNSQQVTNQKIAELADKRSFYQIFKTQEEKDLIAVREELNKKSAASQARVTELQNKLRKDVSDYIAEGDMEYADLRKAVVKLAPVAAQGDLAVKQLSDASSQLTSSQFSSAINASNSMIGAMNNNKPTTMDQVAQTLNQMAVDSALKAGQQAIASAAAFDSQLQQLARGNNSGMFSGSWSGAITRGVLYGLILGKSPLNSNMFMVSNNFFQLGNLSEIKSKVKSAQEAVNPVSASMNRELTDLRAKLTQKENAFMSQL